ncbi:unnamed protein product, partial [Polarella glacialis]
VRLASGLSTDRAEHQATSRALQLRAASRSLPFSFDLPGNRTARQTSLMQTLDASTTWKREAVYLVRPSTEVQSAIVPPDYSQFPPPASVDNTIAGPPVLIPGMPTVTNKS